MAGAVILPPPSFSNAAAATHNKSKRETAARMSSSLSGEYAKNANAFLHPEPLYAQVQRRRDGNQASRTSASYLLQLAYGGRANSAALVIQRAFRAYRLQRQFAKLMALAMSADRLDRRLSLLGPDADVFDMDSASASTPASEAAYGQLAAPARNSRGAAVAAANDSSSSTASSPTQSAPLTQSNGEGARVIHHRRRGGVGVRLRRSVSMKGRATEKRVCAVMETTSQDDLDLPSSSSLVSEVVAPPGPCPPLRGEGFYPQSIMAPAAGEATFWHQEPLYTSAAAPPDWRRRANPPPRPPQRTVSFLAGDTLPRKVGQIDLAHLDAQPQHQQFQSVYSDSNLYGTAYLPTAELSSQHNRSNSSPAPLPNPPARLEVQVDLRTDSPLPPPPYISPPPHRSSGGQKSATRSTDDDLPLPPPPPPLQPEQPSSPTQCESVSSSSSVDSGYARSDTRHRMDASWAVAPLAHLNPPLLPDLAQQHQQQIQAYRKPAILGAPANYAHQQEMPPPMTNKVKKTVRIQTPSTTPTSPPPPLDPLPPCDTNMLRRRQYRVGLNLFNRSPEVGMEYLIKRGFLDFSPSAAAKFLHGRKGLSKAKVGEYLTDLRRPFNQSVLHCFMHEAMDFSGLHLDIALRQLQQQVSFPGEAQKIEKMVEVFARKYIQCNQMFVAGFRSPDTIFVLAYAVVLLNTDLHSPAVRPNKRMRRTDFVRNLRGVDAGSDLDEEMLNGIYDRIQASEFRPGADHVTQVAKVDETIVGRGSRAKPLSTPDRRLVCFCRLSEVPDLNKREKKKADAHQRGVFLFNDLILVTKTATSKKNKTSHQFRLALGLADLRVNVFSISQYQFGLQLQERRTGKTVLTLNARSQADQQRFVADLQESIAETEEMARAMQSVNVDEEEESLC